MLNASNLVAFVATTNPDKAMAFYRDTLGLTVVDSTPYALVFDANGVTLRIQVVESVTPPSYTVLGWEVGDIISTVQSLAATGLSFERFASLAQDNNGIWTTPDGARVAWFKDTDGNRLSITQSS